MSKRKVLAAISEAIDSYLLTGKATPLSNPPPAGDIPNLEEIRNFRRSNPSPRIQAEITRLLSARCNDVTAAGDILVSRHDSEWDWRHEEMRIRARVFELLEVAEVVWDTIDCPPDLKREGWLLVEDGRVVGATEFRQEITSQGRRWFWLWLLVDPEYRRQGVVTRRIPQWEERYPGFVIDQPNPVMWRIIHKAGLHLRTPIKGPSIWVGDDRVCMTTDPLATEVAGKNPDYPQPRARRSPSRFNLLSAPSGRRERGTTGYA